MAYNAVSQYDQDHEHFPNDRGSAASASPPPSYDQISQSIQQEHENLGGREAMENAQHEGGPIASRLGSFMRSVAQPSTDYEVVEPDEYDQETPTSPILVTKRVRTNGAAVDAPHDRSFETTAPLRTASIRHSLPLDSPTPDLQALQGAYTQNIERLEETAERLSMSSSIEAEIQKVKMEQRSPERPASDPLTAQYDDSPGLRQFSFEATRSTSILGVNTAARTGGYSPGGYITSPKGSITAGGPHNYSFSRVNRMSSLPERQQVGSLLIADTSTRLPPDPPPPPPHAREEAEEEPIPGLHSGREDEDDRRPTTRASMDTVEQARSAFVDFDGVHHSTTRHPLLSREPSLAASSIAPPVNQRVTSMTEPRPPREGMVYYPAPVPMMLNLPQKLSRLPSAAEMERRRHAGLSKIPTDFRKSAAMLVGDAARENSIDSRKLPPQLRASAFFDQPSAKQDIEIKGASAVDTLDSILDASAHAPVSAFVDHPIAGRLGSEVYGRPKRKPKRQSVEKPKRRSSVGEVVRMVSSSALTAGPKARLTSRESKLMDVDGDGHEATSKGSPLSGLGPDDEELERSIAPSDDELSDDEDEEEEEDDADDRPHVGLPTTLLAELQTRKEQQKHRNRPAQAVASGRTLLEMDAIAQIQKQSRKQKHITLAWEDAEEADQANFDDEDVPLGVLFKGKKNVERASRPIGLMERREIEENEPLSRRLARIRGEPLLSSRAPSLYQQQQQRASTMNAFSTAALNGNLQNDEHDGETLAERIQRLKAEKGTATGLDSAFASELLSRFAPKMENERPISKTPNAEETLGQRRRRLKEEAEAQKTSGAHISNGVDPTRSMTNLLNAYPISASRKSSAESRLLQQASLAQPPQLEYRPTSMPMFPTMNSFGANYQMPGVMPMFGTSAYVPPAYMNNFGNPMMAGYGPAGVAMNTGMGGPGHGGVRGTPSTPGVMPYMPDIGMGPPLDTKQRANIDQWRQSVMN